MYRIRFLIAFEDKRGDIRIYVRENSRILNKKLLDIEVARDGILIMFDWPMRWDSLTIPSKVISEMCL